jgi:hypothetical protein
LVASIVRLIPLPSQAWIPILSHLRSVKAFAYPQATVILV